MNTVSTSMIAVLAFSLAIHVMPSRAPADGVQGVQPLPPVSGREFEKAGDQRVVFVAARFFGEHKFEDYKAAFDLALSLWRSQQKSAATTEKADNQRFPLVVRGQRFIFGWKNLDSGESYWLGVDVYAPKASRVIDSLKRSRKDGGFHVARRKTNGLSIKIVAADNNNGGVLWRFEL